MTDRQMKIINCETANPIIYQMMITKLFSLSPIQNIDENYVADTEK